MCEINPISTANHLSVKSIFIYERFSTPSKGRSAKPKGDYTKTQPWYIDSAPGTYALWHRRTGICNLLDALRTIPRPTKLGVWYLHPLGVDDLTLRP